MPKVWVTESCWGTDGMHSDMLRSAQMAFFCRTIQGTLLILVVHGIALENTHNYIENQQL